MRKNYFVKLVKYMKNVYQVDHGLNKLSEGIFKREEISFC